MSRLWSAFKEQLFSRTEIEPVAFTWMRYALAALTVYDLGDRLFTWRDFYSESGVLPRDLFLHHGFSWTPSLLNLLPFDELVPYVFLLTMAAAVYSVTARGNRVTTFVTWYLVTSIHTRNLYLNNGGDSLLRTLWLLNCFFPTIAESRRSGKPIRGMAPLAYHFQIILIYWTAAAAKLGTWLPAGVGMAKGLRLPYFATPLSAWFADQHALLAVAAWGVISLELLLPFLLLSGGPSRKAVGLAILSTFHVAMTCMLNIGLFSFVCLAALIALLPVSHLAGGAPASGFTVHPRRKWAGGTLALAMAIMWFGCAVHWIDDQQRFQITRLGISALRWSTLRQDWRVFAPNLRGLFRSVEVDGLDSSGRHRDLGAWAWAPGPWEGVLSPGSFKTHHWMKYLNEMTNSRQDVKVKQQLYVYLCQRWNSEHPDPADRVAGVLIRSLYDQGPRLPAAVVEDAGLMCPAHWPRAGT